jgi:hypothetical protein
MKLRLSVASVDDTVKTNSEEQNELTLMISLNIKFDDLIFYCFLPHANDVSYSQS